MALKEFFGKKQLRKTRGIHGRTYVIQEKGDVSSEDSVSTYRLDARRSSAPEIIEIVA
jgi:hypothetical protein